MVGVRGTILLTTLHLPKDLVLLTLQVKEQYYPVVALCWSTGQHFRPIRFWFDRTGVCFNPSSTSHPSLFTPPSSAPAEQRQLLLLAMLSVWLQNVSSPWLWWLGHRCVICSGTDDGSGGDRPWGYRSGPVPAGPSVQRFITFLSHFHWRQHMQSSRLQQNFVFFFRTTPPLCSAGLCAATWEISLLVKSWAALFLSEMRFKDSPSTDEEKKRWKQPVCMWCGLNISTSCEGVRWRRSIKEQRGRRFVFQRYEKSDGISLPFAPPARLRIWRHKRARGCRDSSLLFSLRVLFWQGRRKGGWLAYLHFPLFFTLFGKRLEKTPIIYIN